MSLKMRGGQSKVFHTPVQQLGLPPLPKRKNIWKKFRHLLTPTWVTKRTNDTRAKRDQTLPPIPKPDSSQQLVNAPNDLQRTPSLRSFDSLRPFTPTSLCDPDELDEILLPESNPVSNLDELVTSTPSSNCMDKDLPPNQLQHIKSKGTLVSLPVLPLQQGEAPGHQNSTSTALEEKNAKDAGTAVAVERSSVPTIPVLPKVLLPRPVKPSTINLRSELPPIGPKAQQLTTRPVTARNYSHPVQPLTSEPPRRAKLAPLPKSNKSVQLTGGKVEHPAEIPPKEECESTPTGNPTSQKIIRIPSNRPPSSMDIDEFLLLDRLDVDKSEFDDSDTLASVTPLKYSLMCGGWERMGDDNHLLNMYREDLEKQEFERELEELRKTHGHLSLPRLRRFIMKRRKQRRQRRHEERLRKHNELERKLEESQLHQIEMMAGMAKFAVSQTATSHASPSQNYAVSAGTKEELEEEMRARRRMKRAEKKMRKAERKIEEFEKYAKKRAETKEKKVEKKAEKKEQKPEQREIETEKRVKKKAKTKNGWRKSSKVTPQLTNCEGPSSTSSLPPAFFTSTAISAWYPPTGCPPTPPTANPSTATVSCPRTSTVHHDVDLQNLSDHLTRAVLMEQQHQAKMVYPARLVTVHEIK